MEAGKRVVRDLEADLAICEAATPGPWKQFICPVSDAMKDHPYHHGVSSTRSTLVMAVTGPYGDTQSAQDAAFIAAAREGWPYTIRRALEAEDVIDRLRNELQMCHEREMFRGGAYD